VNDVAVALEHVDLLDCLDGLDIELLERCLQLLVVGAGALVDLLDLPARGAFASVFLRQPGVLCIFSMCVRCPMSNSSFHAVSRKSLRPIAGSLLLEEIFAYPVRVDVSQLIA
jgi:hypothetical protein